MKKSEHHDIDRLFQIHFDRHEVAVTDRDALWQRIMPTPRKRRFGFMLFFGLLGLVGSSFSLFLLTDSNTTTALQTIVSPDNDARYKKLENIIESNNLLSNNLLPNTLGAGGSDLVSNKEIFNVGAESIAESKDDSDKLMTREVRFTQNSPKLSPAINNVENQEHYFIPAEVASDQNRKASVPAELTSLSTIISLEKKIESPKLPPFDNLAIIESSPLSKLVLPQFSLSAPGIFKDNNPLNDCTVGGGGKFFLDIYSILGLPLDQVSLNPGQGDQIALLEVWRDRFSSLPSIALGFQVGYEFGSGLSIAGGAEYQRLESQYETIQTITERVTVYDPEAFFFFDDQGQIVYVGDSVTAISTYDRTLSVSNSTTMIHIPVELSYPLLSKGNWKIKGIAGAVMNLSLQYRGRYVRPDLSVIEINATNASSYISTNIGLSVEGGVHLGYKIGEEWELYLSPRFRYNQQSYILTTEVVNQSRHFVNLRSGLQYRF